MTNSGLLKDCISIEDIKKISELHIRNGLQTLLEEEELMIWKHSSSGKFILIFNGGRIFALDYDPDALIRYFKKLHPDEKFYLGRIGVRKDPVVASFNGIEYNF